MRNMFWGLMAVVMATAVSLIVHADTTPTSQAAAVQLQLGQLYFDDGLFVESLDAYKRAAKSDDPAVRRPARIGVIHSALRVAEFGLVRREAEAFAAAEPRNPEALSLHADSLWAAGLFDESEQRYRDALALNPELSRGRHGIGRALAAKSRLEDALREVQAAIKLSPRDSEIHHTLGTIYERLHRYDLAAASFTNYVNLLPEKDKTDKSAWARAQIRFLRAFGERQPFEPEPGSQKQSHTVSFKLVNEKVVVRAKINHAGEQDFVVDTGSESTVISDRTAQDRRVTPITYTLSAGVGEVGFRGLQLARLDSFEVGTLKLKNVPCLIKNPPLRNLPTREMESFSPLALGFSMTIDYKRQELTIGRHPTPEPAQLELPLRLYRLATVRGTVDGFHPANFVVDTGGEVISISQATASQIASPGHGRHIPLKVYGTSGWDRDAFLLPGVNLAFSTIEYRNFPVVVLNLDAPSALLGFQLGGIVGHKFLSQYRVDLDLDRSVMGLKKSS